MKTQARLQKAFDKWTYRLGLRWWDITICWHTDWNGTNKKFFKRGDAVALARTYVDWRYAESTIHVNLPAFKFLSKRKIERVVVHELMHVLVNEMREGELHHEERVVTQLTKAVFWTVDDIEVAK